MLVDGACIVVEPTLWEQLDSFASIVVATEEAGSPLGRITRFYA